MLLALAGAGKACAQQTGTYSVDNPDDIRHLCHAVDGQVLNDKGIAFIREPGRIGQFPPPGRNYRVYEDIFHSMAGVIPGDTPEMIKAKMQAFWLRDRAKLKCQMLGFSITGGNILKLAVEKNSHLVLGDVTRRWNLDLNLVDPADGETLLDYVDRELIRATGNGMETVLRRHQAQIIKYGAKRAREL